MARSRWHWASCALGLEAVLASEIEGCGGVDVAARAGGVRFRGPARVGYAVALWSRVAVRVFEELQRGRIREADDLYDVARRVDWKRHLRPDQTLAVKASVRDGRIRHPHYAALKVKDAVVDQLRETLGDRPDIAPADPDLPLHVHVADGVATISRDLAGESLHRRGYRPAQHRSPLNEALAAGLLLLSDWDPTSPLCDPMCGSGTFLIEAALLAGDRAPGLMRGFAFERWVDRDRAAWTALRDDAHARWERGKARIPPLCGNDRHPAALGIARKAIGRAQVDGRITLTEGEILDYVPPVRPAVVVCNPPYGERLDEADLVETYTALGAFLKTHAPGGTGWVLSGNATLTRHLRLKATTRLRVFNGGLECRWLGYPLR